MSVCILKGANLFNKYDMKMTGENILDRLGSGERDNLILPL